MEIGELLTHTEASKERDDDGVENEGTGEEDEEVKGEGESEEDGSSEQDVDKEGESEEMEGEDVKEVVRELQGVVKLTSEQGTMCQHRHTLLCYLDRLETYQVTMTRRKLLW